MNISIECRQDDRKIFEWHVLIDGVTWYIYGTKEGAEARAALLRQEYSV